MSKVLNILEIASDRYLAEKIVQSYSDMQKNLLLNKPKYSGLDAGHFVEAIRRWLELRLFGSYTSLNDRLTNFTESELHKYENSGGPENYRIIIPRVLFSIYTMRNKRGIGHLSGVDPTRIDANYISSSSKWILAEIIRAESNLPESECQVLIEEIVSRDIPIIWKTKDFKLILGTSLSIKEKLLVLLLDQNEITLDQIIAIIPYSNKSRLKANIQTLIKQGLVHEYDGKFYISPLGQATAEKILTKSKFSQ